MAPQTKKYELVARAIQEANSRDPGIVSLQLEMMLHSEMVTWKCYSKMSPARQNGEIYRRLERLGIVMLDDVRRLIGEVDRVRKDRGNELKLALGM